MHFFYGFGAIVGPKTAGLLTDSLGFTWRQVYLAVILPTAAVFCFILLARFRDGAGQGTSSESSPRITFFSALKHPLVWLFCLTLGFMEVIEFGAANWGGLYLKDVYGLDPRVSGASFVSLFYILFTCARLFGGWVIEKLGDARSLFLALAGTIVLFGVGFGLGREGIWLLPFTGLFIGVMWPTLMAYAMRVFGEEAPTVTSVIITISGAVNGVFQLIVGLTNFYAGEAWGYRSCLFYAIIVLLLLYALSTRVKHFGARVEPATC
jgi:fucose permease